VSDANARDAAGEAGEDAAAELAAAREELAAVEREIEDHGEDGVAAAADAHRRATDLLDRYEGSATGTGRENFQRYVEFQDALATLVEGLPEDLPEREAFEEAAEVLDRRRLSESHFERAREALGPAAAYADLLNRREAARGRVRDAKTRANRALREAEERLEDLRRLERLGEADLDAPVERLRDPIEAYNDAVREEFTDLRRSAPARELLDLVERTRSFPLVEFRQPPAELAAYVRENPAGEEPVATLLEYADYSPSKLDHYVEDVGALRTTVAVHRTYLERLDGEPLTVAWPPPPAGVLRRRAEELVSVVGRFAAEETVARLRAVRALPRESDYESLRASATARAELSEAERRRVAAGDVRREREALEDRIERLRDELDG
jgi:hypothetical protein